MARADVQTYELFDEACELLVKFMGEIPPTQIIGQGTEAWLFRFGAKLMIDKCLVFLNNGVEAELVEANEILTNLVSDLRGTMSQLA
jgi:hypothetical protein